MLYSRLAGSYLTKLMLAAAVSAQLLGGAICKMSIVLFCLRGQLHIFLCITKLACPRTFISHNLAPDSVNALTLSGQEFASVLIRFKVLRRCLFPADFSFAILVAPITTKDWQMIEPASTHLDRWHDLLFGIHRSVRYHVRRRAFFERTSMYSLVSGLLVILILLLSSLDLHQLCICIILTLVILLGLMIAMVQRAYLHKRLMRQLIQIQHYMSGAPSERRLLNATYARLRIEAREPPVLHVLNCMCHNEVMRAMGHKTEHMAQIGGFQRLFAHLFDVGEYKIRNPL